MHFFAPKGENYSSKNATFSWTNITKNGIATVITNILQAPVAVLLKMTYTHIVLQN